MNVSEISGSNSNPNIWQFSVAVVVVMLALAISNWLHIITKHGRTARAKEVLKFAALWGRMGGEYSRKSPGRCMCFTDMDLLQHRIDQVTWILMESMIAVRGALCLTCPDGLFDTDPSTATMSHW